MCSKHNFLNILNPSLIEYTNVEIVDMEDQGGVHIVYVAILNKAFK